MTQLFQVFAGQMALVQQVLQGVAGRVAPALPRMFFEVLVELRK